VYLTQNGNLDAASGSAFYGCSSFLQTIALFPRAIRVADTGQLYVNTL
jgi:hypothetical protein